MNLRFPGMAYRSIARHVVYRYSHDLDVPMQIEARDRSARFVAENMLEANAMDSRVEMITDACARVSSISGCFCEFGVYKGESMRHFSRCSPNRNIYGFDSFEGLPHFWRHGFGVSKFKTRIPRFFSKNIKLEVGMFDQTLPSFMDSLHEEIALVHIDCDLYSSTRMVLNLIAPKLATGAVILFDEYFNYPGWEAHEHKALTESVAAGEINIEYVAYNRIGEQVMAVVTPPKPMSPAFNAGG